MALRDFAIKAGMMAILMLSASSAQAATFQPGRGINLDIWTTWPAESEWDRPDVLLPFPEWRRTVDKPKLEALKKAGFDFVRMPVDPAPFLSDRAKDLHDRLFQEVLESVRLVNAAGLKVIVDMHLIASNASRGVGMKEVMESPTRFDAYVALVRRMAETLKDEDPAMLAFEPMNEPQVDCDDSPMAVWSERQKRLWAAARAGATRLTLILTGACFSNADALARIDPRDTPDDNVLWTFHSYSPFLLTHQGATWAGDFIPYVTGLPFPPSSVPRAELDAIVEKIKARIRAEAPWARKAGLLAYLDEQVAEVDKPEKLDTVMEVPFKTVSGWAEKNGIKPENILLGEFGMIRQEWQTEWIMPAASRAAYVSAMAEHAERHGFAWSVWSYGGAFGIVEEFEGRAAEPNVLDAMKAMKPINRPAGKD